MADLHLDRVVSDVGNNMGAGLHSVRIIYRGTLAEERPPRHEVSGGSTVEARWIPRQELARLDKAPFVSRVLGEQAAR